MKEREAEKVRRIKEEQKNSEKKRRWGKKRRDGRVSRSPGNGRGRNELIEVIKAENKQEEMCCEELVTVYVD